MSMKPGPDAVHSNPALQDALTRIYNLRRDKDINLDLGPGPYRDLLSKLGDPHKRLPPTIHVAGTNGKGSTIAMLRALLEADGRSVHVFTSPHLFQFNERIRLAGRLIDDDALLAAIDHVWAVNDSASSTFFEFTTALAFHLFATIPADFCLLETGMGGRLDCTNVIEHPVATVITPVGWDHMNFLGSRLEAIAAEKAGIMKPGVPCIVTKQHYPEAMPVLGHHAGTVGCSLHCVFADDATPQPNLYGDHQRDNAAAALETLAVLGLPIHRDALCNVYWPGRIMDLNNTPQGWRLVYDGAHNIDSARVLAEAFAGERLTLILGMQSGKPVGEFLRAFDPALVTVQPVDLPVGQHPQSGEAIETQAKAAGYETRLSAPDIETALARLFATGMPHTAIITGSLYAAQLIPARYWPMMDG